MMATILAISGSLLALFAILVAFVWIFQEQIAFQPPSRPFPEVIGLELVTYLAQDDQPLLAYIAGRSGSASGLVVCFHGNADLAARAATWAEQIVRETGFAVMLAEYRGYMGLSGHPTYDSSRLDSEAAYVFARDSLHASPQRIAFYGHSLGSAVAAELGARHCPSVLILESPFTSARAMGRIIGWRPVQLAWNTIARFHFDTAARVASINAPVWVAHGERDRLIPPEMGKQVFAAAKRKGQLLLVPDASHNNLAQRGGREYWRWMKSALRA